MNDSKWIFAAIGWVGVITALIVAKRFLGRLSRRLAANFVRRMFWLVHGDVRPLLLLSVGYFAYQSPLRNLVICIACGWGVLVVPRLFTTQALVYGAPSFWTAAWQEMWMLHAAQEDTIDIQRLKRLETHDRHIGDALGAAASTLTLVALVSPDREGDSTEPSTSDHPTPTKQRSFVRAFGFSVGGFILACLLPTEIAVFFGLDVNYIFAAGWKGAITAITFACIYGLWSKAADAAIDFARKVASWYVIGEDVERTLRSAIRAVSQGRSLRNEALSNLLPRVWARAWSRQIQVRFFLTAVFDATFIAFMTTTDSVLPDGFGVTVDFGWNLLPMTTTLIFLHFVFVSTRSADDLLDLA